ncbi:Cell division protein ZapD [Vibrio stylophorae]|uniref:Cell division protein ZapD n=1 Tax=Vibrio stylophorae TaxID=659351 RepID=A0ABM8ZVU1_9VIBR|nr:cell division protein ZapD [Vibrio stylophorae]CAH0534439.1 Cell division protein ZapD [Vibrio stylophorae]
MSIYFYEHPLNERVRSYLRAEQLIQKINGHPQHQDCCSYAFFQPLFDFLELIEQSNLRSDLIRDLQRWQQQLVQWRNLPQVDSITLNALQQQLDQNIETLQQQRQPTHGLRSDRVLSALKPRMSIPAGSCDFDVPVFGYWRQLPDMEKQSQVHHWLESLQPLIQGLKLWFQLTRESQSFERHLAQQGVYHVECEGSQLLRIRIAQQHQCYLMVSAHPKRSTLRFLPWNEQDKVASQIPFELALC